MRSLLEALPGADLPDVEGEAELPAVPLVPPDDDDLIRPAVEEELERFGEGALSERRASPLAKHLLWTFGPEHRALPFMLQLRCEVEDDRLVTVDPEVGWLHQGLEKSLEFTPWDEVVHRLERLHPSNPVGHQLAWLLAVERLCGLDEEIPPRAQLWRVVVAELSRIVEHLRLLAGLVLGHARRGSQRAFAQAGRRVDTLLEIAARVDGRPRPVLGGIDGDIDASLVSTLRHNLPDALSAVQEFAERQKKNPALLVGLRGLGALGRRAALSYGISGPALRAAGVVDDVRLSDPYFAYDDLVPRVHVREAGDTHARFEVRLDEVFASSALILRALAAFEERGGPLKLDDDALPLEDGRLAPAAGLSVASAELPSGELSFLVESEGGPCPSRVRVRTPSFFLAAALSRVLVGARLDEVVPVLLSLGLVGTEVDR